LAQLHPAPDVLKAVTLNGPSGAASGPGSSAAPGVPWTGVEPKGDLGLAAFAVSICGLAGLVCCGLGGIASLVGAILGHVALRQIAAHGKGGRAFAWWGVALGWLGFLAGAAILGTILWSRSPTMPKDMICWFIPCD
jgi:hypothetical protein